MNALKSNTRGGFKVPRGRGVNLIKFYSVNPHYIDTRYNDKIRYTDNLTSTVTLFLSEVTVNHKLCRNIVIQYFKKHMFCIFVRIASPRRF